MTAKNDDYKDIIDLPHHVSTKHPHMSRSARAAQFAPFSALTGYDEIIDEAARYTEGEVFLDENAQDTLGRNLALLLANPELKANISFFLQDDKKSGGAYINISGRVTRYDSYEHTITLDNGTKIKTSDIVLIEPET